MKLQQKLFKQKLKYYSLRSTKDINSMLSKKELSDQWTTCKMGHNLTLLIFTRNITAMNSIKNIQDYNLT
jgi:hypothetical protein